jgi:hypothetical protein
MPSTSFGCMWIQKKLYLQIKLYIYSGETHFVRTEPVKFIVKILYNLASFIQIFNKFWLYVSQKFLNRPNYYTFQRPNLETNGSQLTVKISPSLSLLHCNKKRYILFTLPPFNCLEYTSCSFSWCIDISLLHIKYLFLLEFLLCEKFPTVAEYGQNS